MKPQDLLQLQREESAIGLPGGAGGGESFGKRVGPSDGPGARNQSGGDEVRGDLVALFVNLRIDGVRDHARADVPASVVVGGAEEIPLLIILFHSITGLFIIGNRVVGNRHRTFVSVFSLPAGRCAVVTLTQHAIWETADLIYKIWGRKVKKESDE